MEGLPSLCLFFDLLVLVVCRELSETFGILEDSTTAVQDSPELQLSESRSNPNVSFLWRRLLGRMDRCDLEMLPVDLDSFLVEMELFRVELGSFRVELGSFRVELGLFRVVLGLFRVVLGLFRVVLDSFRVELDSFRV